MRVGKVGGPVRVFISYAHDDDTHKEAVRHLWLLLRSLGVDAKLDLAAARERRQWTQWMSAEIREADFILVVASPAYRERGENRGDPTDGRGVRWESRHLQELFLKNPDAGLRTILPILLPGRSTDDLPDWLLPASATTFRVDDITESGVDELYRMLTDQPMDVEPPLGRAPARHPRTGQSSLAEREVLVTQVVIDAKRDGRRLTCETTVAGSPVCVREAELPADVDRVWEALTLSATAARERLSEVGRALAGAVFDPAGQEVVADLAAGLRQADEVVVVWRAEGAALGVPLELLELTTTGGESWGPLALIGGVSIRRQVHGTEPAGTPGSLPGPLRVLAAVAAPDETRTQNRPLDVEAEMQALMDAVADPATGHGGQVRILEVASLSQIADKLRTADFHVLHLSAHGSPTQVELEDEDGNPDPVDYRELIGAIRDARTVVPLIVLSSCEGAGGGGETMAAALIKAGADRVLAMQAPITDTYATRLLAEFYRELSTVFDCGVAGALARARRALERSRHRGDPLPRPEYGIATLLCSDGDQPLINSGLTRTEVPPEPVPSGASVRALSLGQLIGRRTQLRRATAVLRRTPAARGELGVISGVQVIGVGGIGKTALAGRLLSRLRGDHVIPVVHEGRWNPTQLFAAVAAALPDDDPFVEALDSSRIPDSAKPGIVTKLLRERPVLLVFDDFEQNLTPGGAGFVDPAFDEVFSSWCEAANAGAILVTCRYPLPGDDRYLDPIAVGPLSAAELRRLLLRRPAFDALTDDERRLLTRTIGGHPRLIEYVDALLRGKPTQFREVQAKLKALAAEQGIDLRKPHPAGAAIEDALRLGGADILLDELLELLTEPEREALSQLAVSRAPMTVDDLAHALAGPPPTGELQAQVDRLTDLTLLIPGADVLVHPWTAELLARRPDPDRTARHQRALDMRLRRGDQGRLRYEDLIDLVRHMAATGQSDHIPPLVQRVVARLSGVLASAAYLAEIRPLIPQLHQSWFFVTKLEFEAIRSVGDLASARALLFEARQVLVRQQAGQPHDENTEANLSVLLVDLGDLALTTGDLNAAREHYRDALTQTQTQTTPFLNEGWWQNRPAIIHSRLGNIAVDTGDLTAARDHYQAAQAITERLAAADPSKPPRQRDLSVSREKLGNVAVNAGDLTTARDHYQAALTITERLAAADPGNARRRRDLSIGRERVGDIALAAGDLTTARDSYKASLDIRQQLTATDPGNTEWQRDLSISRGRIGDIAALAGDLVAARDHYQAAWQIRQQLAAGDPGNTEWQRDLSVSHVNFGDIAVAGGDRAEAHAHYQAALRIRQLLTTADPSNATWQRDVQVVLLRIKRLEEMEADS